MILVDKVLTEQFTKCISHDTSVIIDSWAQIDLDFHAYLDGTQLSARTLETQLPPLKKQRCELKGLAHYPLGQAWGLALSMSLRVAR